MMTRYASHLVCILLLFPPLVSEAAGNKTFPPISKTSSTVLLERMDNLTTAVQIVRLINSLSSKDNARAPSLEVHALRGASFWEIPEIRAIHFTSEKRISIVSSPSETMINPEESSFLIADGYHWYDMDYEDASWEKPGLAHPNYRWFYIPGASWIWRHHTGSSFQSEILLLRREFEIPTHTEPRLAILYITLDETLHETYLNGRLLSLKDITMEQGYIALEVTSFIQKGDNILAMKLGKKQKEGEIFSGIAFRLDVYMISPDKLKEASPSPLCSDIHLENGDYLSGELLSISDRNVDVQISSSKVRIDRDWIRSIGISPSLPQNPGYKKRNIFQKIFATNKKETARTNQTSSPRLKIVHPEDSENKVGVLLKSGEFVKGRIIKLDKDRIIFKPRYGREVSILLSEIESLYPNEPGKIPYLIYPREELPWKCKILTLDNCEISGLLIQLTPETLTLKPPYAESIHLKNSRIISCLFPYSSIAGLRKKLDSIREPYHLSVALMGDNDPKGPPFEHSLHFNLHNILIELGIDNNLLSPEEIVDSRLFFPKRYPILFNIDETETYFKTVHTPDDGYNALINYVKQGGILVHMGTGIPAYYGYEPQNRNWKRTTSPPFLNKALGMNILGPGETSEYGQAFEIPDNKPLALYFQLNSNTPYSYGLPDRIEFPFHPDTRFRPVTMDEASTTTLFTPLYNLKSEGGTDYGAAMAIIDYQGGGFEKTRCYYISPLLFYARYNDHPVLYDLIPRIISLNLSRIIPHDE
ncbi:hypothetical protein JW926_17900 [Candidatus Sumerlaeota bacterium]|nr:hypothetical protein [Candidatus Sumerlaeota bacterium]